MNGLDEEYGKDLQCDVLDAYDDESKTKIAAYGFDSHGLVIFDTQGDVQKKMDGHEWTELQIRTALEEVMGGA